MYAPARAGKVRHIDVYETPQALVLVGRLPSGLHRVVIVRRTHGPEDGELPPATEDPALLGLEGLTQRLEGLDATKLLEAEALLGMVRFLEGWYLLLVTRREPVGVLSGHVIFRVDETAMLSVSSSTLTVSKPEVVKPTSTDVGGPDRHSSAMAVPVRSSTEGYGEDGDAGPADKPGMDETKPRRGLSSVLAGLSAKLVDRLRGTLDGGAENRYRAYF